eukprot:NODE_222_length_2105_cov_74.002432_g190_i0.p4 GENE.NODE_222_length_2105_cov_74.002432_g190_i0~~NODE_222_length_2105_cov_74.002432_g190_i0.p4  ORF type:complete len:69 (-),score=9.35 NODE_222_length_2105_cov_74.002432_g190_i0:339-545(-)
MCVAIAIFTLFYVFSSYLAKHVPQLLVIRVDHIIPPVRSRSNIAIYPSIALMITHIHANEPYVGMFSW